MNAAWRDLRWFCAYWISRVGAAVGRFLPTGFWYALAGPVADLCFLLLRKQRRHLVDNLRRVVAEGEATPAARRVFRNFARYVIDFYQLPSLGRNVLQSRIEFNDWQRLNDALDNGNGTVFVTLHLGQAELGAAAMSAYGQPINVIAETLAYAPMNDFVQGLRRSLGMKVIAAKKAKPEVLRCLNRGEALAMMFDAVEPAEGVTVDFFGAPAEVSGSPARIALRTGARVLPAVVARDRRDPERLVPAIDFDLCFEPTGDAEADVKALTQAVARSFERFVRRFPDQWFAFRPVWGAGVPAGAAAGRTTEAGDELWKQWALGAAVHVGALLPRPAAYALARLAGDAAFLLRAGVRRDVEDNMRHVLGAKASSSAVRNAAREAFRNVARYYADLVLLSRTKPEELLSQVRLHGFDGLKSRLDAGQGVIVATAHCGNPEMAVQVGAILGLDVLILAEPLQPPAFARLMARIRSAHGARYENVGFHTIGEALRHLRAGGCLAIACDRDIQDKGSPLPFFGVETKMPLGAAELAARTGAVLMPGYCHRSGDGFDVYFEEPLPLADTGRPKDDALVNARALLSRIEAWIGADPGQWMVLERIWPATIDNPL